MPTMTKRGKSGKQDPKPITREQFNIRMPVPLRIQLEALADKNLTDVTAEIIAACLDRLKANDLWPPKSGDES